MKFEAGLTETQLISAVLTLPQKPQVGQPIGRVQSTQISSFIAQRRRLFLMQMSQARSSVSWVLAIRMRESVEKLMPVMFPFMPPKFEYILNPSSTFHT